MKLNFEISKALIPYLDSLDRACELFASKNNISLIERYGWAWKIDGTPLGKSPSFEELREGKWTTR